MIKLLLKNSTLHFAGMLVLRLTSMVIFILLARIFSPALFGQVSLFVTLVTFVSVLSSFGLNQWYQREHQIPEVKKFTLVIHARLFTLLTSLLIILPFLLLSRSFSLQIIVLLTLALLPEAFLSIYDGYLLENKKAHFIPLLQTFKVLMLGLAIIIFGEKITLFQTLSFFTLGSIIAALIGFPKNKLDTSLAISSKNIFSTIRSSAKYAVLITTSYAYSRGDALIIRYTISDAALGIYSVAYRYLEGVSMLPNVIAQNLFHLTSRGEVNKKQLGKLVLLNGAIGLLISVIIYLSSGILTTNLLGDVYSPAKAVLQILSVVTFFFFVNAPLSTYVQSTSLMQKFLPLGIANTILNLLLNIILVPKYGISAAAYVMLFTEVSGLMINIFFIRKKILLNPS